MLGGRLVLELGGVLVAAAGLGVIAKILRQPPVLAFILAGALFFPLMPEAVAQKELLETLATLGVALLLFWVGMELDLKALLEIETVTAFVAPLQIILTLALGYGLGQLLGLETIPSLYLGVSLSISSTVLALKYLTDRGKLGELSGKIVISILIVQNLKALVFHIFLLTSFQNLASPIGIVLTILKGLIVFGGIYFLGRYLMPTVLRFCLKQSELLVGSSLGFCFLAALLAKLFNFAPELGALLAGLSLASLPETPEIAGKMRLLRDLFLIFFFVNLGKELALPQMLPLLGGILLVAGTAVLVKPVLLHLLLSLVGFRKKTAFLSSVTLGQMGEIPLIIVALGARLGDLVGPEKNLIVAGIVLSMVISSYFQTYWSSIFGLLKKPLKAMEIKMKKIKLPEVTLTDHVVVVGFHRMGPVLARTLRRLKQKVLVVDIDPQVGKLASEQKFTHLLGDIGDEEVLSELNLAKARAVFSTVTDFEDNLRLVHFIKRRSATTRVVVTAEDKEEALRLYGAGADFVLVPALIGGEFGAFVIKKIYRAGLSFKELKEKEIKNLKEARPEAYFHQFTEKMKSWI